MTRHRYDGCLTYLRNELAQFVRDVKDAGVGLWHDRAAQIVIALALLPWLATLAVRRDLNILNSLAQIGGVIFIYWFFTRRQPFAPLPVRRPIIESALCLSFVAVWMLYRLGEYLRLIVFPPLHCAACGDLMETIVPKTIEMVVAPLVLFLALRYSLRQLGLGWPVRAWLPALLPLGGLLYWGLNHQTLAALLTRTFCFYLGAGLPEELMFRGFVQSRLEVLTKRPAWGIFLGGFVFGVSHLPIDLHGTGWANWPNALETAFTYQMGVGLALGVAFQRAHNLWPLTLIHALIDAAPLM